MMMRGAMTSPNQPQLWKMAQQGSGMGMDPKQQVMMAMLQQQLAKAGGQMTGGGVPIIQRTDPMAAFDLYGNPRV